MSVTLAGCSSSGLPSRVDGQVLSISQKPNQAGIYPEDRFYFCEPTGGAWGCRAASPKTPVPSESGSVSHAKQTAPEVDAVKLAGPDSEIEGRKYKFRSRSRGEGGYHAEPLTTVHFAFDSDVLSSSSKTTLETMSLSNKDGAMLAEGYTDNVGAQRYNTLLALRRAKAVKDFLISKGFSADAISVGGKGLCCFVSGNETEQGRSANRRVDLYLAK